MAARGVVLLAGLRQDRQLLAGAPPGRLRSRPRLDNGRYGRNLQQLALRITHFAMNVELRLDLQRAVWLFRLSVSPEPKLGSRSTQHGWSIR
jgi:hypothetical protein